jgi:uncharacterized protein (TIGR02099 family)
MSELLSTTPNPAAAPVPPPQPPVVASGALRWLSRGAALLWWLCVAAAIVFGLAWGVLHGLIVPRIDELRPTLENRLTKSLGAPVQIGSITAQSNALAPSFELRDVRLQDKAGRDALVLKKIIVTLSPRSLVHLGFEQLVIEQPELDVRRDAAGQILVAGFPLTAAEGNDSSSAADWFFSQREFAIRSGTVRWTDERRDSPPLLLSQVDIVVRNQGRSHQIRLDGTPQADWGDRFSVLGEFRSPLLGDAGQWQKWQGEAYADFARVDVSQLKRYADLGVNVSRGYGSVRAWAQLDRGQVTEATADLALADVNVQLAADVQPLVMPSLKGRLLGQAVEGGLRVSTQGLAFQTQDGVVWPGGNVSFLQTGQGNTKPPFGEFKADRLDLAALAQIADRLPIDRAAQAQLRSFAPQGLVETVQATWQGPLSAPTAYSAQGRVVGLALAAQSGTATFVTATVATATATALVTAQPSHPGLRGATVDFKLTQLGGEANVAITQGAVTLPGAFEDPVIALDSFSTRAIWALDGTKIDVKLEAVKFANADAQGEAKVRWQTADPLKSRSKSRFPGVLDLQGTLSRANGAQVHRYLPMGIAKPAREYVRNAVVRGAISSAQFSIKGDLYDIPFSDPKLGEFRIAAQVAGVEFAYVPDIARAADSLPWPPITQLNGELIFDRSSVAVNAATGRMGNGLQITKADARIPDLGSASAAVQLSADTRGPLAAMLAIVNSSPLQEITNKALIQTKATGNADLKIRLNLPIKSIDRSKVAGTLTLANNDVQVTPDTPMLARSSGVILFSETGFSAKDVQSSLLGGEMRLSGGSRPGAGAADASIVFKAQGVASAEGLRQAKELGFVSRLGQNATGSAAYAATLAFRAGVPEIAVTSNLQGMALNLPAPMGKTADSTLALRYDNSVVASTIGEGQKLQDTIQVDLGTIANINYVRDISGKEPRVLRGTIGVGLLPGESAPPLDEGVVANINFAQIDVDAWKKILGGAAGIAAGAPSAATAPATSNTASGTALAGYVPSVIAVRARELVVEGRTLNNVVAGGSREGLTWRANLDARELGGYLEYRQPNGANAGRVYARLARLNLAQAAANEIEAALDNQPSAIPALDIVVEDFELRGKKFGRIEVEAFNRGIQSSPGEGIVREWRLTKFNAVMPEAQLSATGNWVAVGAGTQPGGARTGAERRRTVMNFKLDIADSGELLKRIGMDKVIARGKGKMEGQVAWLGSPLGLDYASLSGNFNVNIEAGQFLKVDPGFGKLLGVLSLQSLPRRLTLDFRDVFTEGFAFDFIRGDVKIDQSVAFTNNLQMKGVNAAVLMEGTANIVKETQSLRVVVVPEINAGTASLVAAAINPLIGLGSFLAQLILRRPLIEAATQEFTIDGTWIDPKITKVNRRSAAAANAAQSAPSASTSSNPPAVSNTP